MDIKRESSGIPGFAHRAKLILAIYRIDKITIPCKEV